MQGDDRMSTDVHRSHFRDFMTAKVFRTFTERADMQLAVAPKSVSELLNMRTGETDIAIYLQGYASSWPTAESSARSFELVAIQRTAEPPLDPGDADVAHMLEQIWSEVALSTASDAAQSDLNQLTDKFQTAAIGVVNVTPAAIAAVSLNSTLDYKTRGVNPAARELWLSYQVRDSARYGSLAKLIKSVKRGLSGNDKDKLNNEDKI